MSAPPSCPADLKVVKPVKPGKIKDLATSSDPSKDYLVPFPLMFNTTSASCMGAPEMAYESNINILNGGKVDAWNTARSPGYGMAYFNRSDLPYYYDLADAFTIGDQYFQSTFTATCPNREMLFTGSNGLSVATANPKLNPKQYCMLDDSEPTAPGFAWETMAETLESNNISWKLYQGEDNFDDNAFAWFDNFRHAKKGNPLYDLGMARVNSTSPYGFVDAWEADIKAGTLPQVTWLVGPADLSEHASHHPADGEDLSRRLMDVLQRYPETYKKTVFILNYDEGGQFYDHVVPPTPPTTASLHGGGQSTVNTTGELTLETQFNIPAGHPIGVGWRVPLMLISPWSRGGYVYSEVADHTSVIQFIEKRFNIKCPNISPWRRAITSDLTAGFDFTKSDPSWPSSFPDTTNNVNASQEQCDQNPPPQIPSIQQMPRQESGVKMQRAIPSYIFNVIDTVNITTKQIILNIQHHGNVVKDEKDEKRSVTAGVFGVYDRAGVDMHNNYVQQPPRMFTVEGGATITSAPWELTEQNGYKLHVHGPNGFVRHFEGDGVTDSFFSVTLTYKPTTQQVILSMSNSGTTKAATAAGAGAATATAAATFTIVDNAYGNKDQSIVVPSGAKEFITVDVSPSGNWYDLSVTIIGVKNFKRRFMGKMETGKDSTTDPAMGNGVPALGHEDLELEQRRVHPPIPQEVAVLSDAVWSETFQEDQCKSERGRYKDVCYEFYRKQEL